MRDAVTKFFINLLEAILINSKFKADQNLLSLDRFRSPLLIASFVLASLLMPVFQLVNSNIKDLGIQYIDGVLISFLISLIVLIFSSILAWGPLQRAFLVLSLTLVISSFLNTFFVPNNQLVSDGTDSIYLATRKEAIYVVFSILTLISIPFFSRSKAFFKFNETLLFSAKLVVALTVLITSYQLFTLPNKNSALFQYFTQDDKNVILGQKNIVVLSFDQIQGSAFKGFLETEDGLALKDKLAGFSFYPNAVSTYPNTQYSVASLFLSRAVQDASEDIAEAKSSKRSFPSAVKDQIGFENEIYYPAKTLPFKQNYVELSGSPSLTFMYALNNAFGLNLYSLFKESSLGHQFSKYAYKLDYTLFEKLQKNIKYDSTKDGVIFYVHYLFSHQPFTTRDNCALRSLDKISHYQSVEGFIDQMKCISKGISNFISTLKKLSIYDDTAIFIISDHGFESNINSTKNIKEYPSYFNEKSDYISRNGIKPLGSYNPLILFKDFASTHPLLIKQKTVSIVDIGPTICDILDCQLNENNIGESIKNEKDIQRQHAFWIYEGSSKNAKRYHDFLPEHWNLVYANDIKQLKNLLLKRDIGYKYFYEYTAADLPTKIGTVTENSTLTAAEGAKGFLSFGPYISLAPGKYSFEIKYKFSGDLNAESESFWDVVAKKGKLNLAEHKFNNTDGKFVWQKDEIWIDRPINLVELRAFYAGVGYLEVEGIRILKLDTLPLSMQKNELNFNQLSEIEYYDSDGLSAIGSWGRWTDNKVSTFQFKTTLNYNAKSVTFNLKAFVTPKNPEQTASVFINDESVGDIQIFAGEAQPKQFTFALPDAQDHKYTIRFEIDKPTTPKSVGVNADTRELGFGFIDMRLLPDEVTAQ